MNALFWQRIHGGSTHFPMVLLLASAAFDLMGSRCRDEFLGRGLHAAALASAIAGLLGGVAAVLSGLVMSGGAIIGQGYEKLHHMFVWPGFGLCVLLVVWRLVRSGGLLRPPSGAYLGGMGLASCMMLGAGYWGGEMLLGTEGANDSANGRKDSSALRLMVTNGRQLFLTNCAHCHGADARGDEGPDLHRAKKSDSRMAALIKDGIPGEMPRFISKLSDTEVQALIAYIHSLR
jgi:mono/diheme cytochrome c family protein